MNIYDAAKLALEALEEYHPKYNTLCNDLNDAIENQPKVEPFGIWHQGDTEDESDFFLWKGSGDVACPNCVKLYTHPAPAEDVQAKVEASWKVLI